MDNQTIQTQNEDVVISNTVSKTDYIAQQQSAIDQNNQAIADLQAQITAIQAVNVTLQANIDKVS